LIFTTESKRFCISSLDITMSSITYFEDVLALGQKAIEEQVHKYDKCDSLNGRLHALNQATKVKEQTARNESAKAPPTFLAKRIACVKKEYLDQVLVLLKELNA
jgi:hypothetical protein